MHSVYLSVQILSAAVCLVRVGSEKGKNEKLIQDKLQEEK